MQKIKVKSNGKLNLSLNILGIKNGFHLIDSVVCSLNIYNVISARKRKDNSINISFVGNYAFKPENYQETTAYKTAKLFIETFKTSGVDLVIKCNIMQGAGIGSASADIAGVLRALKGLYNVNEDIKPIADKLGSDAVYQLNGGFAKISGKGTIVEPINSPTQIYVICLFASKGVNTKECYKTYDDNNCQGELSNNSELIKGLEDNNFELISKNVRNALTYPATKLNDEIIKNMDILKGCNPQAVSMAGSGSMVYALYNNLALCKKEYKKLKKVYKDKVVLLKSVKTI